MVRVNIKWSKGEFELPKMTFWVTVAFQVGLFLAGFMLDVTAELFGWSSALVKWIDTLLHGLQMAQGIVAAMLDREGYKLPPGFSPLKPIDNPKE